MVESLFALAASRAARLFGATSDAVYRIVQEERLSDDYGTVASQRRIKARTSAVMTSFVNDAEDEFRLSLYDALAFLKSSIVEQARAVESTIPDDIFDDADRILEEILAEFSAYAKWRSKDMLRDLKKMIVRDAILISQRMAIAGGNRGEALMGLRPSLMKNAPTLHYIDRGGRRWKGRSYYEMLTHTLLSKFDREIFIAAMVRLKIDKVEISQVDGDDGCKHWDGLSISLTGLTRGIPTYADALESGSIFHPRCRHRLMLIGV